MSDVARPQRGFLSALAVRVVADITSLLLRLTLLGVLTHHLAAREFGLFSQALTSAVVLLPLMSLRLNTACARFFPALGDDHGAERALFSMTLSVAMLVGSALVSIGTLAPAPIAWLAFGSSNASYLVPTLLGLALAQTTTTFGTDFFRAVRQTEKSSLLSMARALLALGAGYAAIRGGLGVQGVLGALIAAEASLGLATLAWIFQRHPHDGRAHVWQSLKPYLKYALPLVPYSLLVVGSASGDRYFITQLIGLEQVGVYAFTYGLIASAFVVSSSMAYVIFPELSSHWARGDEAQVARVFEQARVLFFLSALPISCGLMLVYPDVVKLLAGPDYVLSRGSVACIIVGHVFMGLYGIDSYVIDLVKRSDVILLVLACATAVNFAANAALIPTLGLLGAALATALSYVVQYVLVRRASARFVKPLAAIPRTAILPGIASAAAMVAVVGALQLIRPASPPYLTIPLGAAAYLGVLALSARNPLAELLLMRQRRRS
jgi:O-antigen/teichoic acid export membrane protein